MKIGLVIALAASALIRSAGPAVPAVDAAAAAAAAPTGQGRQISQPHIFVLILDSHTYPDIVANPDAPYLNSLISAGGLATRYEAIRHPSLPNYLALTGGSTFGINSDCTSCSVNARNLADQIEAAGLT